jgi:hypothetical protein
MIRETRPTSPHFQKTSELIAGSNTEMHDLLNSSYSALWPGEIFAQSAKASRNE